jgi:hypothetical protein
MVRGGRAVIDGMNFHTNRGSTCTIKIASEHS